MIIDDTQDPFDLTVPSLDTYFNNTSDGLFNSDAFFGHSGPADKGATLACSATQSATSGCVSPLSTQGPVSAPSEHVPTSALTRETSSTGRASAPSFSFAGMDKLFYNGTPASGNDSSLYIQIPSSENEGGVSCGSEFWVSVTWDKVVPKLLGLPEVMHEVIKHINDQPQLRERAVKLMGVGCASGGFDFAERTGMKSDGSTDSNTNTSTTSTTNDIFSVPNSAITFSSYSSSTTSQPFSVFDGTSINNQDGSRASSVSAYSKPNSATHTNTNFWLTSPMRDSRRPSFNRHQQQQQPNSPFTPSNLKAWDLTAAQLGDLSLNLPTMPAPTPGVEELIKQHLANANVKPPSSATSTEFLVHDELNLNSNDSGVIVLTAKQDTIDPFLLAQSDVLHNEETLEYVWSRSDFTLYKLDSLQGQQAISEPGSIHFIFPPRTMLMTYEKDGTLATPACSNLHPHSNEWLKAQVCHRSCPYRAGTASLKRPKTVREHFRKCVYLDEEHPLKVLSALQLSVLEREANGQLPNRRRGAKLIRLATESANKLY